MFERARIVLVNPSHPGNIGGAARAMKTMGLSRLILVEPQQFPAAQATWMACRAEDIISDIQVTNTVQEAIKGCSLVIGSSARTRALPLPMLDPRECADTVINASDDTEVAILFGREDRGLENNELQLCNYHVTIPTDEDYCSLNLAAAVQVICYELRMAKLLHPDSETTTKTSEKNTDRLPTAEELEYFYQHLDDMLTDIDFYIFHNTHHVLARLRRIFTRAQLESRELAMLRGILSNIQKKVC